MTDQNPQQQNNDEPNDDEQKPFWDKLTKLIDDRFDAAVDRTVEKYSKGGQSRNGQRNTVPKILADLMGGPFKPVS